MRLLIMSNRAFSVLFGVFCLFLMAASVASSSELQRYTKMGGDFSLMSTQHKILSLEDFSGKIILLTFGFTHCQHICPMTLARLGQITEKLETALKEKVIIFFINVDAKDSVDDIKKFISIFEKKDAKSPSIIGFTGNVKDLQDIARRYGATFFEAPPTVNSEKSDSQKAQQLNQSQPVADIIIHTDRVFLLDQKGIVRKIYPKELEPKEAIEDITSLMGEVP